MAKRKIELWERQPEENHVWFPRFVLYSKIERSKRTVALAYEMHCDAKALKPNKSGYTNWGSKADEYNWAQRAKALDHFLKKQREDATVDYYNLVRYQMQEKVDKMLKRIDDMLDFPLTEQETEKSEDGKTFITIIKPAGFSVADVPKYMTSVEKTVKFMVEHGLGGGVVRGGTQRSGHNAGEAGGAPSGVVKATRTEAFDEMPNDKLLAYVLSFCGEKQED